MIEEDDTSIKCTMIEESFDFSFIINEAVQNHLDLGPTSVIEMKKIITRKSTKVTSSQLEAQALQNLDLIARS